MRVYRKKKYCSFNWNLLRSVPLVPSTVGRDGERDLRAEVCTYFGEELLELMGVVVRQPSGVVLTVGKDRQMFFRALAFLADEQL